MDVLVLYMHFLGLLLSVGILMAEVMQVKKTLSGFELRKLGLQDAAFGMNGAVLITDGLLLRFKGSKPSLILGLRAIEWVKKGYDSTLNLY